MTSNSHRDLTQATIVCETFNHAEFLPTAIEGFLAQECDFSVSLLFHDDASTDGTQGIIKNLGDEVNNVRIECIRQTENQYSQGIRPHRFSFLAAKSRYIAWCEGDDYWIDPRKVQKQVHALERHPEVDICVHPAVRLSMRTGKQKKSFEHGSKVRVIDVSEVIARYNQFAPTASVVMRTEAAKNLPTWFFEERGLPVGDFFIEAILGRKGVLYLPEAMSVYRRGVPGSYTNRFRQSSGPSLEESLHRMIYFTEKLRGMEGIPETALDKRIDYIKLNYALQFLAIGDHERFIAASREIQLSRHTAMQLSLALMRRSSLVFRAGRQVFRAVRRYRG